MFTALSNHKRIVAVVGVLLAAGTLTGAVITFNNLQIQNHQQVSEASSCTINPAWVWNCYHYKTTLNNPSSKYPVVYSGVPTTLHVGQTYVFSTLIQTNNKWSGGWGNGDRFGISISQVLHSPASSPVLDPNDKSITVETLSQNRSVNNDIQQAVDKNANPITNGGSNWTTYQCAGSTFDDANYSHSSLTIFCTFTPEHTGFFQVDTNSYNYYTIGGSTQDCVHGYCGPESGLFVKVVTSSNPTPTVTPTIPPCIIGVHGSPSCTPTPTKPTSTPTRTPTPTSTITTTSSSTPTPGSLFCDGLTVSLNGTVITSNEFTPATNDTLSFSPNITQSTGNIVYSNAVWTINPSSPALTISSDKSSASWNVPTLSNSITYTVEVSGISDTNGDTLSSPCGEEIILSSVQGTTTAQVTPTSVPAPSTTLPNTAGFNPKTQFMVLGGIIGLLGIIFLIH